MNWGGVQPLPNSPTIPTLVETKSQLAATRQLAHSTFFHTGSGTARCVAAHRRPPQCSAMRVENSSVKTATAAPDRVVRRGDAPSIGGGTFYVSRRHCLVT